MKYSRIASALTAAYGVFALAKPRHLADNLKVSSVQASAYDRMAYTYAGRDLAISSAALLSRNPAVVTTAMLLRIAGDLADATVLATSTSRRDVRTKVLGATLGWAAVNTLALVADRRAS